MAECDSYQSILADIRAEWDQAEKDIKLAEQVCGEVVIPSIKELRYAGRRIVDALNEMAADGDEGRARTYLQDAKFNCHRARHDAIDVAISKIAITLDLMSDKLGYDAILKVYPGFSEFFEQLSSTREKIVESRANRENREALYSDIENIEFQKLVIEFGKLQRAEPIMKSIAKKQRLQSWGGIAGIVIGVISIGVSILIAIAD